MTDTVVLTIFQVLFNFLTFINPFIHSYNVSTIIRLVLLFFSFYGGLERSSKLPRITIQITRIIQGEMLVTLRRVVMK